MPVGINNSKNTNLVAPLYIENGRRRSLSPEDGEGPNRPRRHAAGRRLLHRAGQVQRPPWLLLEPVFPQKKARYRHRRRQDLRVTHHSERDGAEAGLRRRPR